MVGRKKEVEETERLMSEEAESSAAPGRVWCAAAISLWRLGLNIVVGLHDNMGDGGLLVQEALWVGVV